MLPSTKHLAIGFNLLGLLLVGEEVGAFSGKWYTRAAWRQVEEKRDAPGNKALGSTGRVSFEERDIQYPSDSPGRNNGRAQSKFLFPDEAVDARLRQSVPVCEGTTFCEDISGYPTDLVSKVIKYDRSLKEFENVDATLIRQMDSISQRMDVVNSESLCLSMEKVVYPKTAESMNKEWLFILNHPNFTQGVRIETCVDQGHSCKMIDGFAEGYSTSCEQKYIYRQLTAITPDGSLSRDFFRFPASCCCHVQFTGMESRFRLFDDAISVSKDDGSSN